MKETNTGNAQSSRTKNEFTLCQNIGVTLAINAAFFGGGIAVKEQIKIGSGIEIDVGDEISSPATVNLTVTGNTVGSTAGAVSRETGSGGSAPGRHATTPRRR